MAGIKAGQTTQRGMQTVCVLIVALLLLATLADSRPVASGWNLSQSAGSSDGKLWRKFPTHAQTVSYHRTLLDLEKSQQKQQALTKDAAKHPVEDVDFNTMDYANPRSNDPGSSDNITPPSP